MPKKSLTPIEDGAKTEKALVEKLRKAYGEADTNMSRIERATGVKYHRVRGVLELNYSPTVSEAIALLDHLCGSTLSVEKK